MKRKRNKCYFSLRFKKSNHISFKILNLKRKFYIGFIDILIVINGY